MSKRLRPQKSVCACDWGIAGCEEDGTGKRHRVPRGGHWIVLCAGIAAADGNRVGAAAQRVVAEIGRVRPNTNSEERHFTKLLFFS